MESAKIYEVYLNIYDLSMGLARTLSPMIIGKQINGIWHTGVVVYGSEFFFGGGICQGTPSKTPFGAPVRTVKIGETSISQDIFIEFLRSISDRFSFQKYNLFTNNCSNFSDEVCLFLTGKSIPNEITGLPQEVLNTPLGQMISPFVDSLTQMMGTNEDFGDFPEVPIIIPPQNQPLLGRQNTSPFSQQNQFSNPFGFPQQNQLSNARNFMSNQNNQNSQKNQNNQNSQNNQNNQNNQKNQNSQNNQKNQEQNPFISKTNLIQKFPNLKHTFSFSEPQLFLSQNHKQIFEDLLVLPTISPKEKNTFEFLQKAFNSKENIQFNVVKNALIFEQEQFSLDSILLAIKSTFTQLEQANPSPILDLIGYLLTFKPINLFFLKNFDANSFLFRNIIRGFNQNMDLISQSESKMKLVTSAQISTIIKMLRLECNVFSNYESIYLLKKNINLIKILSQTVNPSLLFGFSSQTSERISLLQAAGSLVLNISMILFSLKQDSEDIDEEISFPLITVLIHILSSNSFLENFGPDEDIIIYHLILSLNKILWNQPDSIDLANVLGLDLNSWLGSTNNRFNLIKRNLKTDLKHKFKRINKLKNLNLKEFALENN
ncbi:desumoylating isopeptidase 1 [Anaeramoeba ignava]|uniref:Desumoylating isopeptidase 1 n=1 Tax=Anaeramoeba ignava TaxID=1746090 RepID=A0A9Q0LNG8_ANAIG|nr:desumoylating isopeptidase 1 [Anaeramoeba ignava]